MSILIRCKRFVLLALALLLITVSIIYLKSPRDDDNNADISSLNNPFTMGRIRKGISKTIGLEISDKDDDEEFGKIELPLSAQRRKPTPEEQKDSEGFCKFNPDSGKKQTTIILKYIFK